MICAALRGVKSEQQVSETPGNPGQKGPYWDLAAIWLTCDLMSFERLPGTYFKLLENAPDCLHTAEVGGSNPSSPTVKVQVRMGLRNLSRRAGVPLVIDELIYTTRGDSLGEFHPDGAA